MTMVIIMAGATTIIIADGKKDSNPNPFGTQAGGDTVNYQTLT
ncbi:hypothetical protein J2X14_003962 [Pantoea alhagi]|nr:hypothetical protein [Pantoea alhagi]